MLPAAWRRLCLVVGRVLRVLQCAHAAFGGRQQCREHVHRARGRAAVARRECGAGRAHCDTPRLVGEQRIEHVREIERILDLLPRGAWLGWIFSLPFSRPLAERFYRWFARNRYQLGCGAHCQYRPQDVDFGDA